MAKPPPYITDDTVIGPDIDLEKEDIRLPDGTRLTQPVADEIVAHVRRTTGRPSLSGKPTTSPTISFRIAPAIRDRAAEVAAREGKTVSQLAREALEARLTG